MCVAVLRQCFHHSKFSRLSRPVLSIRLPTLSKSISLFREMRLRLSLSKRWRPRWNLNSVLWCSRERTRLLWPAIRTLRETLQRATCKIKLRWLEMRFRKWSSLSNLMMTWCSQMAPCSNKHKTISNRCNLVRARFKNCRKTLLSTSTRLTQWSIISTKCKVALKRWDRVILIRDSVTRTRMPRWPRA